MSERYHRCARALWSASLPSQSSLCDATARVAAPSVCYAVAYILLAAAPTAPPCFRHWRRSSPLPQRGSHWRAGPLFAGCLRPDRAQKSGPRLRGQRLLNKSALSSCCESRPQGTTVSDKIKLCLSRVGLTDTPVPLPMGRGVTEGDGEGLPPPAKKSPSKTQEKCGYSSKSACAACKPARNVVR